MNIIQIGEALEQVATDFVNWLGLDRPEVQVFTPKVGTLVRFEVNERAYRIVRVGKQERMGYVWLGPEDGSSATPLKVFAAHVSEIK